MSKYLNYILIALILVVSIFYLWERHQKNQIKTKLNNEISKLEGMVKESESIASARSIKIKDLEDLLDTKNKEIKELVSKIKDRDEDIVALTRTSIQWKNKYFKIKDAKETIVGDKPLSENCKDELKNKRFKVEFKKEIDYLKVYGHTLTNPAYAEVNLEWKKELKLDIVLTKDKEGKFRIYLKSDNKDALPTSLELFVDPSVLSRKWYEKIMLSGNIGVGDGLLVNASVNYLFYDDLFVGPSFGSTFDGQDVQKFYGVNFGWFPFR